ncbi:MAG: hypothetical protein ACK526_21040 [Planctomyces sp.]|jgi:hypothetical protein
MNAQVLLLAMITGLFVTVWDGDQAAMNKSLAMKRSQQSMLSKKSAASPSHNLSGPLQAAKEQGLIREKIESRKIRASESMVSEQVLQARLRSIPLPEGIPAGEYQAVSQSGETIRIVVNPQQEKSEKTSHRDLYISDSKSGIRWFLVRLPDSETM